MIITAEVSELTRKIKLPTDRVLSVNGDYQVDGIAFKLPATYEGDFDFSTAAARVHWTGVDKVEHTNLITEEDGNGYPLWIMPSELTQGGHGVIEFAISFVATDETAAITKRWISDPVSFRNRRTVSGSNEDEEAEEKAIYDRLASAIAAVRAAQASVDDVAEVLSSLGTLTFHFVDAKADMTDQTKLYVLTTDGYLYYYSTAASDFVPAFEVGGSQEVIDARTDENGTTYANLKTRINTGFTQLKEDLNALDGEAVKSVNGTAPDANGNVQVEAGSGSGLTDDVKTALLACFDGVAWKNAADGVMRYNNLYDALYAVTAISLNTNSISLAPIGATSQLTATTTPAGSTVTWTSSDDTVATVSSSGLVTSIGYGTCTITATAGSVSATCAVRVAQATLTSITAVYTQSGAVYTTDSLDDLKDDIVVIATYSDSTTATVPSEDYTLSGALAEGTSTITVTYGGKTATFNVTVSASPYLYVLHDSDFSKRTGVNTSYPYYIGNKSRVLYTAFDLRITGGKSYRVRANTSYNSTAQMGLQCFTNGILGAVNAQKSFGQGDLYDPGWQNLDTTVEVPEFYPTGYTGERFRIIGARITFRQSTSNPNIADDFVIKSVTIEEVEAS